MWQDYFQTFLKMSFTFIMLMDPIGNIPPFVSVAGGYERKTQVKILKKAILIAGIVLLIFVLGGRFILTFFGISSGAFYIAGGIIFFTIALDMIQSKPKSNQTPEASLTSQETTMIAVFPLAFPLIAGPGMITTIMVYTATDISWQMFFVIIAAIAVGLLVEYIGLRSASFVLKFMGTTGIFVMEKIVGLILAGLSIQLIYEGLEKLGIIGVIASGAGA